MTSYQIMCIINDDIHEKEIIKKSLADRLGVHVNTLRAWLTYQRAIPADYLIKLLHELNLDIDIKEKNNG